MNIKPRGKKGTLWLNTVVAGTRVRQSLGTTDYAQAERVAARIIRDLDPSTPSGWTLHQAFERTLQTRWKGSKSEVTMRNNASYALQFFGMSAPLVDIRPDTIDAYVDYLERHGNGVATINRKLTCLRTMLNVAFEREALEKVPKFPLRKESAGRIRFLTDQEEFTLVNLMREWGEPRIGELFVFLADTGVRLGEALRLEWRDVTDQGLHLWETKSGKPRSVPLTVRAREAMGRPGQGRVYLLTRSAIRHWFLKAKAEMHLEDDRQFVVHTLRHTCASRMVQRGVPLKVIQEWLGHANIQTTMRYAHLAPSSLQGAVKALEDRPKANLRIVK